MSGAARAKAGTGACMGMTMERRPFLTASVKRMDATAVRMAVEMVTAWKVGERGTDLAVRR